MFSRFDQLVFGFCYINYFITEVAKFHTAPEFFYGTVGDQGGEHTMNFVFSLFCIGLIFITSFVNAWTNTTDLLKKLEQSDCVDKIEYKKAKI